MELPKEFLNRMESLLGDEYPEFLESYQADRSYGLRVNPLKCLSEKQTGSFAENAAQLPFCLTRVPWAEEGFYFNPDEHPGKHILHEGGAYYIQEPSAMSVVSLLEPEPGDIVCDLCAAPGGKSTQIAGRLLGSGLLISNEISPARAKILSQNIERFGAANCIVCNEPPDRMALHFPHFFTKIVVDAPCSGEGMFRKDAGAVQEWSMEQITLCTERQKMILECADAMLAPDGIIVYSTCTFAPEEDEQMIAWFLQTHSDYELEDWRDFLPDGCGLSGGSPVSRDKKLTAAGSFPGTEETEKTLRLFPHKLRGEGHFAARLHKKSQNPSGSRKKPKQRKTPADISLYLEFLNQYLLSAAADGSYSVCGLLRHTENLAYFGNELYLIPPGMNSLQKLKIVRAGLHLGTRKKNRFEPSHALAMALHPKDVRQCICCDETTALQYLHGETIPCSPQLKAWTLVSYQGVSLGWGKAANGNLKNHYPKGLRIMY
ncbi:MAG: RsmF rRNA methyltransferase first C-terminal domain-containing protein [Clostridiaceae bacterium]|nr:RsmF rRNA methyltransferase first C-terminal domain-containing protein [Clostridiaceae bacterium]